MTKIQITKPKYEIISRPVSKLLLSFEVLVSLLYLYVILFRLEKGNSILFSLLAFSEVFHVWLVITLIYTLWPRAKDRTFDKKYKPDLDVFITVVNEPLDIVRKTVLACQKMDHPVKNIYILNDGRVANYEGWQDTENLAVELGISCITREIGGGAKAGNINHALTLTKGELVAVFDADHVPHANFASKMVGYFSDSKVGFVQSPQYYHNFTENEVTYGASEQQELFFGPIMSGKSDLNTAFMCGTNMVIRRSALESVGGLNTENIAEDFMTSLDIHKQGYKSVYVPHVLAEGLAPEDFLSYCKQQFRWARGSMEVLFWSNPILDNKLSWKHKLNYLISASYYLSGIVVVINLITPVLFLLFGLQPLNSSSMLLPALFLPYVFFSVLILNIATGSNYTFRALAFSNGSFWIFCKALLAVLLRQNTSFTVTSKEKVQGNFAALVWPHILYCIIGLFAVVYGFYRYELSPAFLTNLSWVLFNVATFVPFIRAAIPEPAWLKALSYKKIEDTKIVD
jgi:cellulose synthase (UDP-forming)